jgi:hypothetical protein
VAPLGDAARKNVTTYCDDPDSALHLCRKLLALPRIHPEQCSGDLELLDAPPDVLDWCRRQRFSVWLNLGDEPRETLPGAGRVAATTHRGVRAHQALPARTTCAAGAAVRSSSAR